MAYSLAQAAVTVGKNRSTILRAIKIGRLSAERDAATGAWAIQPAELLRVYPVAEAHVDQHGDAEARNTDATAELRELRTRIAEKDTLIAAHERALDDLRHRLDEERADRRQALDRLAAAQERIAALLTDQRPAPAAPAPTAPRRWWNWRRQG